MCNERTGILLRAQNGRLPSRRRAVIDKDELQKMTEVPFSRKDSAGRLASSVPARISSR
jgi:hypothetical protein